MLKYFLLPFLMRILYHVLSHQGERIWAYFTVKTTSIPDRECLCTLLLGMLALVPQTVFLPLSEIYCDSQT